MTTSEAAAILGVRPQKVHYLIITGRLHAVRVGRRWTISRMALDTYQRQERQRWVAEFKRRHKIGGQP